MKKSYSKPLVYCKNIITGVTVSNDYAYEQSIKEKLKEFCQTEQYILAEEGYSDDESNE